jgi:hypothetical protein
MEEKINVDEVIPKVPEITASQLEAARKTGRYEAIAFEEYKFVAQFVALVARIEKDSGDFKRIPSRQYHILCGLMNRCARLILGTMELSHKGKFGETAAIIFRCIAETGIKIIWLCEDPSEEKFDIYINDGLKPELELEDIIQNNIKQRADGPSALETRMLKSIVWHIKSAETNNEKIKTSKKMPDMASLLQATGFHRTMYVALYRMGSHHIHGTWPSLLFHYLEKDGSGFSPRGNDSSAHANEFLITSLIMTRAIYAYSNFTLEESSSKIFKSLMEATEKEIVNIFNDIERSGW